jgi:hypothetical protein
VEADHQPDERAVRVVVPAVAHAAVIDRLEREEDEREHRGQPDPDRRAPSAADFKRFRDDPFVLFEDEIPDRYRLPAGADPAAVKP